MTAQNRTFSKGAMSGDLKLQRWQGHPRNLTRHSVADRSLSQIRTYEHCDAHSTEDRCKSNQNRICLAAQTISKRQAAYLFFRARPRVCPHRAVGNVENRRCLGECHEHKRVRNPVTLLKSAAATPLPSGRTVRARIAKAAACHRPAGFSYRGSRSLSCRSCSRDWRAVRDAYDISRR